MTLVLPTRAGCRRARRIGVATSLVLLAVGPVAAATAAAPAGAPAEGRATAPPPAALGLRLGGVEARAAIGGIVSGGPVLSIGARVDGGPIAPVSLDASASVSPGGVPPGIAASVRAQTPVAGVALDVVAPAPGQTGPEPPAPTPSAASAPPAPGRAPAHGPAAERPSGGSEAPGPPAMTPSRGTRRAASDTSGASHARARMASGPPPRTIGRRGPSASGAASAGASRPAAAPDRRPTRSAAERIVAAAAAATRSPWLAAAVLIATIAYVLGQRMMDRGAKLSHAGLRSDPDDELIEL